MALYFLVTTFVFYLLDQYELVTFQAVEEPWIISWIPECFWLLSFETVVLIALVLLAVLAMQLDKTMSTENWEMQKSFFGLPILAFGYALIWAVIDALVPAVTINVGAIELVGIVSLIAVLNYLVLTLNVLPKQ